MEFNFDAARFEARSLDEAKALILTPHRAWSSEDRWEAETPRLVETIRGCAQIAPWAAILDYGCGVGRVAKGLIEATGAWVVGVDPSPQMRGFATLTVNDPRFSVCSPERLGELKFDLILAVWVLQHCPDVGEIVRGFRARLRAGGKLFVVNNAVRRAIPVREAPYWVNDMIDVRAVLRAAGFEHVTGGEADWLPAETRWDVYRPA